ncbi:hypothetical protein Trydic_g10594, partial [Trypoxylus dichotomus]
MTSCKRSEYQCENGECVGLDKHCNGFFDCTDQSDEPSGCS